ncbi:hypothetical protein CK203_074677 [Vitis vinifera]|uniref:CAND6/7 N-terminal domain-containing protein n=1 Tax=Vitis vinifera TaxID=29760 RepID=A0A438DWA0_VITVI|nr:hypothetical protein CK203_074677 [Vitis vinifera]
MTKTPLTFLQVLSIFSFSVLLLLLPFVTAEIKTLTITADSRPMILFEKFGFTHTGHVTVSVSGVSVASTLSSPDPSRLGFFLLSEESLLQVLMELQQNPSFCVLDSQYILSLFTFRDLSPPPHASFNQSYPVSSPTSTASSSPTAHLRARSQCPYAPRSTTLIMAKPRIISPPARLSSLPSTSSSPLPISPS